MIAGGKTGWIIAVLLTFMAVVTGLVLWFGGVIPVKRNPLFHGKLENEKIKNARSS